MTTRPHLFFVALTFLAVGSGSCSSLTGQNISIPPGVIDCGIAEISKLAISLIDDVTSCIGAGKQNGCDLPKPSDPTKTQCTWKKCVWDLAKKQGQAHAVEAALCAVDQAGADFGAAFQTNQDPVLSAAYVRSEEFITESGARLKHRVEPGAARPNLKK